MNFLCKSWFGGQLTLVAFCAVLFFVAACDSGERYDDGRLSGRIEDGKREGLWKAKYFSGEKWFEGRYSNDRSVGEWTWWYDGGGVKEVSTWQDSMRSGEFTTFYENGEVKESGNFFKNMKVDEWSWFYDNGQKKGTGKFVNGKRVGEFVTWHQSLGDDGEQITETIHLWQDTVGTVKAFHPNGELAYEGAFNRDRQDGIWKFYNEKGELYSEQIYRNGIKVGGN